ncbi:MAG: cobalamin-dependent protein [Candidatus Bathyarchaeota archaeon]|nr:MAG: cobalamin-dependent protein [Candidatus Bathyarchaeota archaeon]
MPTKVLFVEPPKDVWFVMGEYLPPPFGIIQLGAYLEQEVESIDVAVIDCNAEQVEWRELATRIEVYHPDIVASSALSTCNTYVVARTLELAKKLDPSILTVAGGQHFTATAQKSLETYPEIDVIVRGEGEVTLAELARDPSKSTLSNLKGASYRADGRIVHNPERPFIKDLERLPLPGYHLVKDNVRKYHFAAMAGHNNPYALIEGSRGCAHSCTFCTQWRHWRGSWRVKSPKRIADEMEYCYQNYGSRFIWLTDDNFGSGDRAKQLGDELLQHQVGDDMSWFLQMRCDDVLRNEAAFPTLKKAGLQWVMVGVESSHPSTLTKFRKNISREAAKKAVRLLRAHDIFAHVMFIIGERSDTSAHIAELRQFVNELDPDFVIFTVLTPFPGTEIYEEADRNGWIEDHNLAHYDMAHAIMPTETMTINEVQEELYECYRSFYGSWKRRLQGMFARNRLKRRINLYMARRGILRELKTLF